MITIIGLGNPGDEYAETKHNAGRIVLEHIISARNFSPLTHSRMLHGETTEGMIGDARVRLFVPHTYMNLSGGPIAKLLAEPTERASCIVIADEVDLPVGTFKIAVGKGSGGHNGIKSIIDAFGNADFTRIRIGIAHKNFFGRLIRPQGDRLADFVLSPFTKKELGMIAEMATDVNAALEMIVTEGVAAAMNAYNGDTAA